MPTGPQMIRQMGWHGVGVVGDKDALLTFGPQQEGGIAGAERRRRAGPRAATRGGASRTDLVHFAPLAHYLERILQVLAEQEAPP